MSVMKNHKVVHLRCGKPFNDNLSTDLLLSLLVKEMLQLVLKIWQSNRQEG